MLRLSLKELLAIICVQLVSSTDFPLRPLQEGASIEAYIIGDTGNCNVKRCPVSDPNNCEVIVDRSRLSYPDEVGYFYPGGVAIERVDGYNRAVIVSDRGYSTTYNIAIHRCLLGSWAPCTVIHTAGWRELKDNPHVEVVLENGYVKGYLIAHQWEGTFCAPDDESDTGYTCTVVTDANLQHIWGTAVHYSADGNTPLYYIFTRYREATRGVYQCATDFSGCTCKFSCGEGGSIFGTEVEYGADGEALAYLFTDGSDHNVYRCPLSSNRCEVAAGITSATVENWGFNSPNDVAPETDQNGDTVAWLVVDRGNSRLMRCPVGAPYCFVLTTSLNRPVGFTLEWTSFTTTTTSSTTTSTSSITTSTTTSSTTTSTTSTTTSTSTNTTTSTSTTTSTRTTTTTSTSTITTSSTSTSTTTRSTTTSTSTTSSTSSTTSTSTTTSTITVTTSTSSTSTTTTSTTSTTTSSTSSLTTTTTSTSTTTSSVTNTTTTTSTTTTSTSSTTTSTSSTTTVTSTTSTTSTTTTSTTSTSATSTTSTTTSSTTETKTTTVLSLSKLSFEEVEHYIAWSLDDETASVARAGNTVTRQTEEGQIVVACGITVADCGAAGEQDLRSPAVVTVPEKLKSALDDHTVVYIASLPEDAVPALPTLFSLVGMVRGEVQQLGRQLEAVEAEAEAEEEEEEEEAIDQSDDSDDDGGQGDDDESSNLQLISEVVSIQLLGRKGSALHIADIQDPIQMSFRLTTNFSYLAPFEPIADRVTCAYWNTSLSAWAVDGVELVRITSEGSIICQAQHLTVFAVFMDFTIVKTCATLTLFANEGVQSITGSQAWWGEIPAILYFALLGLLWIMVAAAIWIDAQRHLLWSDDFYFDSAGTLDDEVEAKVTNHSTDEFTVHDPSGLRRVCPCCSALPTPWGLARTLCLCGRSERRHVSSLSSNSCSKSDGDPCAKPDPDCSYYSSYSTGRPLTMKDSVVHALLGLTAKHAIHSTLGFHTFVTGTTLEHSGIIRNPEFLRDDRQCWRGGMSQDFLEHQRCLLHALPNLLAKVAEDNRLVTMLKLFLYWHPLFDVGCLDVQIPATRKALAYANSLLGSLLISLLIFETTGSLLSGSSPALCELPFSTSWFMLVSLASTMVASIPAYFSLMVSQRRFHRDQESSPKRKRRRLCWWLCLSRAAWLCDLAYLSMVILYTCLFLANLHAADESKWTCILVTILGRWFLLVPFFMAVLEAGIILLMDFFHPQFLPSIVEHNLPTKPKPKEIVQAVETDITESLDVDDDAGILAETLKSAAPPRMSRTSTIAQHLADNARWERAVTVREVMEFYMRLPTIMPTFDPLTSTIADVTRLAILPLTQSRETLVLEILDITNAELLESMAAGFQGRYYCRFGTKEVPQALTASFEDHHWSLESEMNWIDEDDMLLLTIFKETADFDVDVAYASIPATSILHKREAQTQTLTLIGSENTSACELQFRISEVEPSLESLYRRFHQPILVKDADRGLPYADWVSRHEKRTPQQWLCASAPGARFASLVAAVVADAIGFRSYEVMSARLLDLESQKEVLAALQGEFGSKLYWITPFCEDLPRGEDETSTIEINRARLYFWAAECAERQVPQLVLVDHIEHFRPDLSFFYEVLQAYNLKIHQQMLAPSPAALSVFFNLVERITAGDVSGELQEMFRRIHEGTKPERPSMSIAEAVQDPSRPLIGL